MPKTILSTKKLSAAQRELILNAGLGVVDYNALQIELLQGKLNDTSNHVIITSKNAIHALRSYSDPKKLKIYCVGEKTGQLLNDKGYPVTHIASNGHELGNEIVSRFNEMNFTYLTTVDRRSELPDLLHTNHIKMQEHYVYKSTPIQRNFDRNFAAVLFYSPNGVYAFAKANSQKPTAICIGNTTASACREFYEKVIVAKKATVENTIVTAINTIRDEK